MLAMTVDVGRFSLILMDWIKEPHWIFCLVKMLLDSNALDMVQNYWKRNVLSNVTVLFKMTSHWIFKYLAETATSRFHGISTWKTKSYKL